MPPRDDFEIEQTRDIGRFFAQLRIKMNKSQRELAELVGCSQATITKFEKASEEYRFSSLQKIARTMGYRLEISVVPIDESINTRIVARPNSDLPLVPVREQRRKKPQRVHTVREIKYETEDEFDVEAEMALVRERLAN